MGGHTNGNGKNHVWGKLLFFLLIILSGFLVYRSGVIQFFLDKERLLAFVRSFGSLDFLGFILLQAAQVVVSPIPGDVTGLIGGYLFGVYRGIILSTVGLTIGSYAAFSLSRSFGRPFVEKFVNKSVMDKFDYLLHSKGVFLIFLLFFIPGFPKDYLCYILGIGHLTALEFIVISTIGRLFGTILLTLGGEYIRVHQYHKFALLVVVALAFTAAAVVCRTRIEAFMKSLHQRENGKHGGAVGGDG